MYQQKKTFEKALLRWRGKKEEEILEITMLNSLSIVVFIWEIVPTFFVIYESK